MSHPFQPEDLELHRRVTGLHGSVGQDTVVFSVRSVDRENDGYQSRIWAAEVGAASARQLTDGTGSDSAPRLSPDGRQVAFLSTRHGGTSQVHLLDLAGGGHARQLGQFDLAVTDLRWTPDGRALVATAAVAVDPERRGQRGPAAPAGTKRPKIAWKLPYKSDGVGYLLAREIHLFALDAHTGERQQLSDGAFDVFAFDVAPDSRRVAYVRTREDRFAHRTELWVCGTDGSGHRCLTREFALVMQPAWSPDGRHIAFSGARLDGDARATLWWMDVDTAAVRPLGGADLEVADATSLCWSPGGEALYFSRAHQGRHEIARMPLDGGAPHTVAAGNRQLGALAFTGSAFVFAVDAFDAPSELWRCGLQGQDERALTDLNPWWRERTPLCLQERRFEVADGRGGTETVHGWLMHAQGARGPMPLLDDAHGGPAAYALLDYDTNVYWQVLCAQGWAVLALNAVGSASYGREFCDRLQGHWGEYDLPQHLQAIDQLRQEGWCDDRVAIAGKSYGGYMSSWAIGQSDRFRAAVVMAPVGNVETHYGTSDGGYYADPLFMGSRELQFDRAKARALSPLQHVEKARTPTLFLQGEDDERCPKCQSEELFVTLVRASDTAAELVLYPGEDHHFLGQGAPSCRVDAAGRIVSWLAQHAAGPASAALPDPLPHRQEGPTSV